MRPGLSGRQSAGNATQGQNQRRRSPLGCRRRYRGFGQRQSRDNRTAGAAALALVRLLAATRPVTLWAVSGQNISRYSDHATDAAFGVQIETAPLDVARAAWLLASPDAFRRAAFAACQTIGGYPAETDINWLSDSHIRHPALLRACLPALTGCEDFLLVPSLITSGETQFDSDSDAAAWVKTQLAERGR